jgi:hypothetical protein
VLKSPNDVRVPFRIPERCPSAVQDVSGFARPQPAYRSASVPFRPAFRSGQFRSASVHSFARSPNDVRVLKSRNDVRVLFRLPPGLHQAATRSSPANSGNDVRVLESPKRPSAVQAAARGQFASVPVVLRAIALSSMRSSEVSVVPKPSH